MSRQAKDQNSKSGHGRCANFSKNWTLYILGTRAATSLTELLDSMMDGGENDKDGNNFSEDANYTTILISTSGMEMAVTSMITDADGEEDMTANEIENATGGEQAITNKKCSTQILMKYDIHSIDVFIFCIILV